MDYDDVWARGPFAGGGDGFERRLRRDAGAILRACLEAVRPAPIVERALRDERGWIARRRVHAVAVGKAAAAMAAGAAAALGDALAAGLAVVPADGAGPADGGERVPAGWEVCRGGHPEPTRGSARAGRAVLRFARAVPASDLLLVLLSGGASALMTVPADDVPLDALRAVTARMLAAGAPIDRLNAVRKHLDALKGGGLALATQATVLGLAISDVPGDAPGVIGSGPLSADPATFGHAVAALRALGLWDDAPPAVRRRLERGAAGDLPDTPKPGDPRLDHVRVRVIAGNGTALDAAARAAGSLGYRVERSPLPLQGEAREVGARLGARLRAHASGDEGDATYVPPPAVGPSDTADARPHTDATSRRPVCLLSGGETTVTVRGTGIGGRSQELALAAAAVIDGVRGALVAAIGTDGIDGPTDAAGALVDGATMGRARALGVDADAHLERNDAYGFFARLDDLVITGPTGTNVMDVQLALAVPRDSAHAP